MGCPLYSCFLLFSVEHFNHALFAGLSIVVPETWTDVLNVVGLNTLRRTALLGSVILHSWSNKILFCTSASSVPLVPC